MESRRARTFFLFLCPTWGVAMNGAGDIFDILRTRTLGVEAFHREEYSGGRLVAGQRQSAFCPSTLLPGMRVPKYWSALNLIKSIDDIMALRGVASSELSRPTTYGLLSRGVWEARGARLLRATALCRPVSPLLRPELAGSTVLLLRSSARNAYIARHVELVVQLKHLAARALVEVHFGLPARGQTEYRICRMICRSRLPEVPRSMARGR